MKKEIKDATSGISLVALVVTIVVLLILAGITITYVMGDNSIIKKAFDAKTQTEIAKLRERIEVIQSDWWIDKKLDPAVTLDDFWERLIEDNIITSKDDIEGPEKEGENDVYLLDTTEGYTVEVIITPDGNIIIGEIVPGDNLPPKVQSIQVTNKTSNSIEIKVAVSRLEDGKLSYYYKKEDEITYRELVGKQDTTDLTAMFTQLEQNKIYNIKVVAENKKGKGERTINVLTRELAIGVISQKGETVWSNNKASIELETTETDLTLKYQINGIDGTWLLYEGSIGNLNHGDTVYAILTDGTNYGEEASIEIRDGKAPIVTVTKGAVTTNSITVTASAIDNQWGMPESPSYSFFIKKSSESTYPSVASYTGTNTSYTFTGLIQNTDYDVKVTTRDKAQNEGTGTLLNTRTGTVGGASGNLATGNIIASSPTWNVSTHTASITLSTTTDLQIQWQKNGIEEGKWTTVAKGTSRITISSLNHADNVYARLYDGTNYGDEAYVAIRDGIRPMVTVTKGAVTTNSITVTASATDNQWGMPESPSYSFFIKKSSESTYPSVASYTGTNTSYTFTGLIQNTDYDVKVTTRDKAQNEGTGTLLNTRTGTIGGASGNLATGNIIASSPTWASGKASITLSTTSGMQIQWQKNGIEEGKWTTVAKGTSRITISSLNHADNVYARLYDGTNYGDEAYVAIRDGVLPSNATITLGATTANTGVNVTAKVTHNDSQSGPKIASCKWVYNTTATAIGTTVSKYTGGTFSSNGQTINLKATAPGTYYLHVLTIDMAGNAKETISSAVTVKQLATGITVSPTTATVQKGGTKQLTATVTPTNTSNKGVTWSSSNTSIATVSSNGLVTTKAAGTVTITVKTADGSNKTATCSVTVKEPTVSNIVGQIQTSNKIVQDENGNKITVPGGFKVVPNGTGDVTYNYDTNHRPCVQDGIVIEDGEGNQFVWIPVGNIKNRDGTTTTITLGRYEFYTTNGTPILKQNADNYAQAVIIQSNFQELTSNSGNTAAKNLRDFVTKTKANGGYYLGRYEASQGSDGKVDTQVNKAPWVNITQPNAATKARGMYSSSYVDSDLINSYSWDTAIVFIQKYSGNSNYANKKSVNSSKLNTGKAGDKVCNIHDMASNCYEWSTEHSTNTAAGLSCPCVNRGGVCFYAITTTSSRILYRTTDSDSNHSFRPLLYLK